MTPGNAALERSVHLQELTRQYSRFSRSAGGLAAVGGGLLCLASFLVGGLLPAIPMVRGTLIAAPMLWLIAKQWMANRYYQRFGLVEELASDRERRIQRSFVGFAAVISFLVGAVTLAELVPFGIRRWDIVSSGYLLLVLLLPLVVWRWLRTPLDFIIGVFLLCQAALAIDGRSYPLWSSAAVFPVAALILIGIGIRDHRRFRAIEAEIRQLGQSRPVGE